MLIKYLEQKRIASPYTISPVLRRPLPGRTPWPSCRPWWPRSYPWLRRRGGIPARPPWWWSWPPRTLLGAWPPPRRWASRRPWGSWWSHWRAEPSLWERLNWNENCIMRHSKNKILWIIFFLAFVLQGWSFQWMEKWKTNLYFNIVSVSNFKKNLTN